MVVFRSGVELFLCASLSPLPVERQHWHKEITFKSMPSSGSGSSRSGEVLQSIIVNLSVVEIIIL